ncbi:hypothetical protein LA76x_4490 [Lysobacter antibioticus]|uniref:Uncharacterized protein n=1 Tax=Lysobacter antibioticus TaxID=84531 RepID=A0A0S2FGD7_LYSAN|nr:hypothetical protein LA76x_4490 [Lysobacter antibioticus]
MHGAAEYGKARPVQPGGRCARRPPCGPRPCPSWTAVRVLVPPPPWPDTPGHRVSCDCAPTSRPRPGPGAHPRRPSRGRRTRRSDRPISFAPAVRL